MRRNENEQQASAQSVAEVSRVLHAVGFSLVEAHEIADRIVAWEGNGIPLDSPLFQGGPPPMGSCLREGVIAGGKLVLVQGAEDPWGGG